MTKLDEAVAQEAGIARAARRLDRRLAHVRFWRAFRGAVVSLTLMLLTLAPVAWSVQFFTAALHWWWPAVPTASYLQALALTLTGAGVAGMVVVFRAVVHALREPATGRPITSRDGAH